MLYMIKTKQVIKLSIRSVLSTLQVSKIHLDRGLRKAFLMKKVLGGYFVEVIYFFRRFIAGEK